jgi:effector-binding domain-containing protein
MIEVPHLADIPAQSTAVIHLVVPASEIRQVMGPGITEVLAAVAAQGLPKAGAWFTHHFRPPTDVFDFEVGIPVVGTIAPTGRVRPAQLPAARVARTAYVGGYEGLGDAWAAFEKWIRADGHDPASELWEHYAVGPESGKPAEAWRTELVRPLLT